jgi:hypothetical protein
MLPLSFYHTAAAASSASVIAAGRSSVSHGSEYKPWDVKQEGGQRDSGWGTGENEFLAAIRKARPS